MAVLRGLWQCDVSRIPREIFGASPFSSYRIAISVATDEAVTFELLPLVGKWNVIDELPAQYREGVRLFNEEEFFECHDVLEELWAESVGDERLFLQGLIQASIALFHFGNENFGGAKKLYLTASTKLAPYGDEFMGIRLSAFLSDLKRCFQELLDNTEAYPTTVAIRDELVPKIQYVSQERLG